MQWCLSPFAEPETIPRGTWADSFILVGANYHPIIILQTSITHYSKHIQKEKENHTVKICNLLWVTAYSGTTSQWPWDKYPIVFCLQSRKNLADRRGASGFLQKASGAHEPHWMEPEIQEDVWTYFEYLHNLLRAPYHVAEFILCTELEKYHCRSPLPQSNLFVIKPFLCLLSQVRLTWFSYPLPMVLGNI